MQLNDSHRLVVKIGSSSIVDTESKSIITDRLASIAEDIHWLVEGLHKEVILMSSGALAWGRICVAAVSKNVSRERSPQIAGACGQVGIAGAWASAFERQAMMIGQLLLIPEQAASPKVQSTIRHMLASGIVPYINENTPTMESYDNDGLAAELASHLDCDALILLSDVDGVYSSDPTTDPNAVLMAEIGDIDEAIRRFGGEASSSIGTGGMMSKLQAAKVMTELGVETIIANGERLNPLRSILTAGTGTVVRAG